MFNDGVRTGYVFNAINNLVVQPGPPQGICLLIKIYHRDGVADELAQRRFGGFVSMNDFSI